MKRSDVDLNTSDSRKALVKNIIASIDAAKKKHERAFKNMRADMKFCAGKQQPNPEEEYTANFTLRHVNNKTASLYAKTPTVKSEVRQKLHFSLWDGDPKAIADAQQAIMMVGSEAQDVALMPEVQASVARARAVLADYKAGTERLTTLERVGKTLETLLMYHWHQCRPDFKGQCKAATRRCVQTGVAWCKVGYQRETGISPDIDAQLADDRRRLAFIQGRMAEMGDDAEEYQEASAEVERLNLSIANLQKSPEIVLREGLVYSWPKSDRIILDPETVAIKGFIGCRWLAEEYYFTRNQVRDVYGVEVQENVKSYTSEGEESEKSSSADEGTQEKFVRVCEYYDRESGLMFTVCDGHEDFLGEPSPPRVDVESFFPYVPLTFNDVEDGENIYPPSDVRLMRDMQNEYNRSRHGLREHRIANRPGLVSPSGVLSDEDKGNLGQRPPNVLMELTGWTPGNDIRGMLAPVPTSPIDPNLYETAWVFDDVQRVVGVAEANIGGVSNSTATESSIAESTRQVGLGSNVDDMDEWLSEIARASGQVLLALMEHDTVMDIVGPGAVWPKLTRAEIMRDVYLTVEAGSSGKPNKALEVNNWERLLPFLLQMPGISPRWMVKETLKRLDERVTVEEAYMEGAPSIAAMNGAATPEGMAGAQNAPGIVTNGGGGPNVGDPTAHQRRA